MFISIPDFNIYENIDKLSDCLLIINDKKLLYSYLMDLYSGCTNKSYIKLYDQDNKQLKVSEYIDFVISLIDLDINSKKNINSLIRIFKKQNDDILDVSCKKIINTLNETFNILKLDSPIDILSEISFNEDDVFKHLNILIKEEENLLLERINNYIKVSFELRNIKIFIFYNLFSLLDNEEIKLLLNTTRYNGISIINIEKDYENIDAFSKIKLLDYDNCLLESN